MVEQYAYTSMYEDLSYPSLGWWRFIKIPMALHNKRRKYKKGGGEGEVSAEESNCVLTR